MKKDENGNKVYADVLPKNLSIEKSIYRPMLLKVLPAIGGTFAEIMNVSFEKCFALAVYTGGATAEVFNGSFETVFKYSYAFSAKAAEIFSSIIENIFLYILIGGVIAIRFGKSIYDYVLQLILYFFFNYDEISYDGERTFRKDAYFSRFSVDKHGEEKGERENLSVSLLLFGIGVVAALVYLIL